MVVNKFLNKTHKIMGRSLTLVFLSCILLLPLFGLLNVPFDVIKKDNRKVVEAAAFNYRAIDKESKGAALFKEPLISITFDDGRESVYKQALPLLNKYGVRTTQYLLSGTSSDQLYLSDKQIAQFYKSGHEIACHSVNHPDLTTLDDKQLTKELSQCQKDFKVYGSINNFASPYGHSNTNTITHIKRYYSSHRNTNGDITNGISDKDVNLAQNFDKYNIISASIRHDTTVEQLEQSVDYAIKNNGWLVFTYHQIEDTDNSTFGLDPESLETQLKFLSSSPIKIVTMHQALQSFGQ